MPIVRTYHCPECNYRLEVTLPPDQWDAPLPTCPECDAREMGQEFKPPAIGGSVASRAAAITESIMANDYGVANYRSDNREGSRPQVTYKDSGALPASSWGPQLEQAIQIGRATRQRYGSGLDVLAHALKSGAQPDLIEQSKRRAIKVW